MIPTIQLSNGVEMPVMGQGTYPMIGDVLYHAMLGALEHGCSLFDTAHSYPNEESIGDQLANIFRRTSYSRKDVFLTSKIGDKLDNGMPMGYYFYNSSSCFDKNHGKVVRMQVEDSLKKLRTDYVDLLLIHWPYNDCLEEIWIAMEDLYREGKTRAIGVSNHRIRHLERIMKVATVTPMVDQLYISPLNTQSDILLFCREYGIVPEAYSPVMFLRDRRGFERTPDIAALCAKYQKSVIQLILRWNIQKGVVPIPKSATYSHIRSNYDVFDFELLADEVALIDGYNEDYQYLPESVYCPGY